MLGCVLWASSCESSSLACPWDDVPCLHPLLQQSPHLLHVGCGVLEEVLVSLTQCVESLLTASCGSKAVLGALASAGKEVVTLAAVAGQGIAFLDAEAEELGFALHVGKVLGAYVAESVFGVDEVVTHVHVAVVLHHESVSAGGAEGAERGLHTAPLCQGDVEELYE